MEVKKEIVTKNGKKLQLLKGDLTSIPDIHKVDILVVSAFSNDYYPTSSSLIGALNDAGLSVAELANHKESDLRAQFNCWLSQEIEFRNISRILCFEPTDWNNPYSLIAGIFQSIMPFTISYSIKSVAMPLVLTGHQGFPSQNVIKELISTSLVWLSHDSSLEIIKIVEIDEAKIELLVEAFENQIQIDKQKTDNQDFDFFVSYTRKDAMLANIINESLGKRFSIFFDSDTIEIGENWVGKMNKGLQSSKRFIVCFSPDFFKSDPCNYELMFCNKKLIVQPVDCILPICFYPTTLQYPWDSLNYYDATPGSIDKVNEFCNKIIAKYGGEKMGK